MRYRWLIIAAAVVILAVALLGWIHFSAPPAHVNADTAADLGMMLLEGTDGVSVLAVRDGSIADKAGIRPGDMLLRGNEIFRSVDEIDMLLQGRTEATFHLNVLRADEKFDVQMPLPPIIH